MFHTAWGKVPNGDKYKEFYTEHAQVLYDFLFTVKAAPYECLIRTV